MATATTPPPVLDRAESRRRVVHPLQRLRSYIRLYVAAEGLGALLIYLGVWFWLGLALDYGFFKLFGVDWVQELPWALRAAILALVLAGLAVVVAVKVIWRLFREFGEPALALVLERRFPTLLGDRLITAVEMADSPAARRYGYSQTLIDETVRGAAANVEQLPLGEVFNWRRLGRYSMCIAILTVGLYLLTGLAYAGMRSWRDRTAGVADFPAAFREVSEIWFDRNVLLRDTIWPRRAHLEVLGFPSTGEIRIGRDAPPMAVRVRAWQWVVADADRSRAPEGWRPMAWSDLRPPLIAGGPPPLPKGWRASNDLTVDEIDLRLWRTEVAQTLGGETLVAWRNLFARLEELAAVRGRGRQVRKLVIPAEVKLVLHSATGVSEQTLQRRDNHEYSGTLNDLKESVRLTARGEDYVTRPLRITVVPPPEVVELNLDEDEPAYLYHRPPRGGTLMALRGLRQRFRHRAVSLTGERSTIEVPVGTHLLLTGVSDKPLQLPGGVRLVLPQAAPVPAAAQQLDARTFQVAFVAIKDPLEFMFELHDTDGVSGQRRVLIRPVPDQPPEVETQLEILRKTAQGYLCTPWALVPFSGKARDDRGLSELEYVFTLGPVETAPDLRTRAVLAASAVPYAPGGIGLNLATLELCMRPATPADGDRLPERRVRLATFDRVLRERAQEEVPLAALQRALDEPVPGPQEIARRLIAEHNLDPDSELLDVGALGLESADPQVQRRYRLRLRVVATDNDAETGPHESPLRERFTILVVSEEELLAEIAKEEEGLYVKLKDTVDGLKEARAKLEAVIKDLPGLKPEELSPATRRAEEFGEAIAKGWNATREVHGDYGRILKELKANNGRPGQGRTGLVAKMITKVDDKIVKPLEIALDPEFPAADDSMHALQKKLEGKEKDLAAAAKAHDDLTRLIDRLTTVMDAMADLTSINELIKRLVLIRDAENAEVIRLKDLHDRIEKDLLEKDK